MKNTIKQTLFFAIMVALVVLNTGCSGIKVTQIGRVSMVSNRNVDKNGDYILLKSYMGASEKELKKANATTIEDAIDQTVRNSPGGEYLMNVKVYAVQKKSELFFAVEGDVWGIKGQEGFRGFKVGDIVQWNDLMGVQKGTITSLKDSEECMVQPEGKDTSKAIRYDKLAKVGGNE